VCDASALFEFLVDSERGPTVGAYLEDVRLHLPEIAYYETANVIRRAELHRVVSRSTAAQALADLLSLETDVYGFHDVIERVWELRRNVTVYDAAYIALAEALECTLVTFDEGLADAAGIRCDVVVP
jgi:predicted nucleic acid-binding protein